MPPRHARPPGSRRKCQYKGCKNVEKDCVGKRFFCFPNPNKRPELFKQWITNTENIKVLDSVAKNYLHKRVCEDHFKEACFRDARRLKLWHYAVPEPRECTSSESCDTQPSTPNRPRPSTSASTDPPILDSPSGNRWNRSSTSTTLKQTAGETDGTTPSSSNFASTASTASCPPLEPVESVIIKEEVDVDDDYSANTSETSRHGDDMDFEGTYNDMEQTDPLEESRYVSGGGNFEETDSKQGIAGSISAVKEDYVDKTESASAVNNGLSTILRIADSLALDINNILTDDLIGFNDVNPTQPRGKTLSSSEKDPTLAEVKSKCSKLEQKLRIHYLKIMLKKEEELVDIKIAASKVYLQNAQMEAQQKMEAHLQKMENLKLEHRLLKLRLEKEAK